MSNAQPIAPCLWFDTQAEEAAQYYTGIFKNSKIGKISRYTEAGREMHGKPAGSVMTVAFELNGQPFTALNGGPAFQVQRGHLVPDHLRDPGGDRLLLEQAVARAATRAPRCAAGSRTSSASPGRSCRRRMAEMMSRSGPGEGRPGDGGDAADEEARHRGAAAGLRWGDRRQPALTGEVSAREEGGAMAPPFARQGDSRSTLHPLAALPHVPDPVVQPALPPLPELDRVRHDAVAAPVRRAAARPRRRSAARPPAVAPPAPRGPGSPGSGATPTRRAGCRAAGSGSTAPTPRGEASATPPVIRTCRSSSLPVEHQRRPRDWPRARRPCGSGSR